MAPGGAEIELVGGIAERFAGVRMKMILPTTRLVGLFAGGGKRLVGGFIRTEFVHLQTDHWLRAHNTLGVCSSRA